MISFRRHQRPLFFKLDKADALFGVTVFRHAGTAIKQVMLATRNPRMRLLIPPRRSGGFFHDRDTSQTQELAQLSIYG